MGAKKGQAVDASDNQPPTPDSKPPRKKNARIVCVNENEFWTTQKQFWKWVREGLVEVTGQQPLTGRFGGRREKLLVMVRHVILDNAHPAHKAEVLGSYDKLKPHVSKHTPEERDKIIKKENRKAE